MLFQEALILLEAGASVRRDAWSVADGYLKFLDGMTHIWKIVVTPNANAGNYIFSVEDLKASDWNLLNKPLSEEMANAA